MDSRDKTNQSQNDLEQFRALEGLFTNEPIPLIEKIESFPKYISRQCMGKFLTKYELFKKIINVNGSIIECGVLYGAGLLTWAKLSSLFESSNHTRKIIGFDTFEGFPSLSSKDTNTGISNHLTKGGLKGSSYESVMEAIKVFDLNRPISHIPKVEIIKGDICQTASKYLIENPHLVVSLLYLDVDLYEPTKEALKTFLPRMPKGSIIVFDELNAKIFPGETEAVQDVIGLNNLKIERFNFDSYVSYAIV
ncbi:dTDP-6-deoxy-L-hexose 4-O-methyltransferase [Fibrobacteria bacterium R8-3-H12]